MTWQKIAMIVAAATLALLVLACGGGTDGGRPADNRDEKGYGVSEGGSCEHPDSSAAKGGTLFTCQCNTYKTRCRWRSTAPQTPDAPRISRQKGSE